MDPTIARLMVEERLTELRRQAERERLVRVAAGAGEPVTRASSTRRRGAASSAP